MKKILILSLLACAFVGTTEAKKRAGKATGEKETSSRVEATDPEAAPPNDLAWKTGAIEAQDLAELLELKNMFVYKYDLSGVRDTTLQVMVQLDEYFGRDSLRTVRLVNMGKIYEYRNSTYAKTLKFQLLPQSDSTMLLYCDLGERMMTSMLLKKRKAEPNYEFYASYQPKPFDTKELKVDQTVPVLLFGSSWYDARLSKRYGGWPVYRFCMEDELPEDMRSESFDNMPHYWVIRVGLQHRRE